MPLAQVPFDRVDGYDRQVFGVPRTGFLRAWVSQPDGYGAAVLANGDVKAYGFLRPCRSGFKLGPVFADDAEAAGVVLQELFAKSAGGQVQLDVPEPNEAAVALAQGHGLEPVFGCARMVHGKPLPIPLEKVYGVTSFEFG